MNTQIADAVIHIDESLKEKQLDILNDHMRMQDGIISVGYSNDNPHLMIVEYNPACADPVNFIHMVERHGFHAERIG